jgi:PAS domain S-box-containing protein
MKKSDPKEKKNTDLRKRAEGMLAKQKERLQELSSADLKKLVHELGTHQIELEMQNEELRGAQAELESSRARYADLFDFSPVGYFLFDKNGLILDVNFTGAEMLGIARRLLLNKPVQNFIDPAHRTIFRDHLLEAFRTQTSASCEITLLKKGGAAFCAQLHSLSFAAGGGDPGVCHTAASDVTERTRTDEALKQAKALSDALNRINKAVHSTFDLDEIMLRVIREAGEAIGCDSAAISLRKEGRWVIQYAHGFPQEVVGSHLHDDEHPHAVLALKTSKPVVIEDALHDGRLNVEHMKKHGIRSVLVVPLVAGEEHLGVIFFNHHTAAVPFSTAQVDFADKLASTITLAIENAHLFEERKRARYELEAVNIDLEAFSYSVSHDLREPLRSIEGFTTAILEDCAPTLNDTAKDYFNRVVAASRRMSQLIDALLIMARLTRGELVEKVVNLSEITEVTTHEIRKKQPERRVEFVIAPGIKVRGDMDMLRIVIENLLDNAWKFTDRHPTAKIEFGTVDMDGRMVYFVRDDGAGFDMQYADKLFQPFKRIHTESEFPGLGIGLAIAHRIILRHNGRLWAESAPEKGATFYFTL